MPFTVIVAFFRLISGILPIFICVFREFAVLHPIFLTLLTIETYNLSISYSNHAF